MDKLSIIVVAVVFLVLTAGIVSYVMSEKVMHDEEMYITAGVLIQDYSLYTDFSYLQMPYLPLLYGTVYHLTGTERYLLTARIISIIFTLISAAFVFLLAYKLTTDMFVAICTLLFFTLNETMIWTMGFAWNAIMPITFSLIGIYIFISAVGEEKVSPVRLLIVGVLLALAAGTKLYYAIVFIPFIIVSVLYPKSFGFRIRLVKVLLPLLAGFLIGSLPVLYYMARDFDVFWFNNVGVHFYNELAVDGVEPMSLGAKLQAGLKYLGQHTTLVLFVGVLFLVLMAMRSIDTLKIKLTKETLLLILLVVLTIPVSFVGSPVWEHYFAVPLPFVILLIPVFYKLLPVERRETVQLLLICLVIVVMLYGAPQLYGRIDRLAVVDSWEPVRIHREAREMREYIGEFKDGQKVATLYPLYALEAGLPVYREFSSGVFLYQLGDMLSREERERYVTTSPNTLIEFLTGNPPRLMITVMLRNFEKPFFEYADEANLKEMERLFLGHTLFINDDL